MPGPNDPTGTTPQGSEPQDDRTDNTNPISGGNPPKLIAGKFRTVEEAVEHGYTGLERGYHQLSEQVGALTRVLEAAMTPSSDQGYSRGPSNGGVPIGSAAGGPDAYGRRVNPEDIDAASFLTDPNKVFQQREERLLSKVGDLVGNVVANAMAVNEFKARNRDLVPHERVVQSFMRDLDPRQYRTTQERLEKAGQMAREYLTSVRGGPSGVPNQVPQGDNYVEPPSGGQGNYTPPPPTGGPNQMSAEEKELLDYIAERNANLAANFGVGYKDK